MFLSCGSALVTLMDSITGNQICCLEGRWPMPLFKPMLNWQHINAVYRAGLYAEITACAFIGNNGMHEFSGAQNRIYGAGLNTLGTADAFVFANKGDGFKISLFAVFGIQFWCRHIE